MVQVNAIYKSGWTQMLHILATVMGAACHHLRTCFLTRLPALLCDSFTITNSSVASMGCVQLERRVSCLS
jgi:hypothetical protein